MIVRSFLQWFENAPVNERVEAAHEMAQVYLSETLGSDSRQDAEAALTLVLDDPSPAVRRMLAWEFAAELRAPRHIVIALAHDTSEVAALVLARSPLLREADLVDCAAVGDVLCQTAIAMRSQVSIPVSAALAEVAEPEALVALVRNASAEISATSLARMLDRCPDHAPLRQAMHDREDLPLAVRQALVASVSRQLLQFVGDNGWMAPQRAQRMISETRDNATVTLAARADDLTTFVEFLRQTAQLTPSLLLRSLLCGETGLFGAALVSLTGLDARRVAGILKSRNETPFFALYLKAGLTKTHFPAFNAALSAIRESGHLLLEGEEPRLQRFIVQRALGACLEGNEDELRGLIGLLRRFDAEAARLDARIATLQIMNAPMPVMLDDQSAADHLALTHDPLQDHAAADQAEPTEINASETPGVEIDLAQIEADLIQTDLPNVDNVSESTKSLHVIEDRAKQLDERFFANWQLRRKRAA